MKNKKQLYGLKDLRYDFIDSNKNNLLSVYNLPSCFLLGKNRFKITLNSKWLLKGSQIYIDIIDSKGNSIFYTLSKNNEESNSYFVTVYIYSDTSSGECTIYFAGRVSSNPVNGTFYSHSNVPSDSNYIDNPNAVWFSKVPVNISEENLSEVFYKKKPEITFKESQARFLLTKQNRYVDIKNGSGSINLSSNSNVISQYNQKDVDKILSDKTITLIPQISGSTGFVGETLNIPQSDDFTVVKSKDFLFSSSYEGGTIRINNIQYPIPKDAQDTSIFIPINYSASVVSVVQQDQIKIYPPLFKNFPYVSVLGENKNYIVDKIYDHTNFTMSYYSEPSYSISDIDESFVKIELSGIEPSAGSVDYINIKYKELGSFGNYVDIGNYKIKPENILIDNNSLKYNRLEGLTYKSIGFINSGSDILYWTASGVGIQPQISASSPNNTNFFQNLIVTLPTNISNKYDNYASVYLTSSYFVPIKKDTQYSLNFQQVNTPDSSNDRRQLDVYISGASVYNNSFTRDLKYAPLNRHELGSYIGSVDSNRNTKGSHTFDFYATSDGYVTPKFVIRSGNWNIGRVSFYTSADDGYSPNYANVYVPLKEMKIGSELLVNLSYYNKNGVKSNLDSELFGVLFEGRDEPKGFAFTGSINEFTQDQKIFGDLFVSGSISAKSIIGIDNLISLDNANVARVSCSLSNTFVSDLAFQLGITMRGGDAGVGAGNKICTINFQPKQYNIIPIFSAANASASKYIYHDISSSKHGIYFSDLSTSSISLYQTADYLAKFNDYLLINVHCLMGN
jgi:hypothetical protein